jgi:hypothetical protein
MSFLDDVWNIGKSVLGVFSGNSIGSQLARAAGSAFVLNQVTKSVNKDNAPSASTGTTAVDPGVRQQTPADINYRVPVVYGTAQLSGALTAAEMADQNKTMYVVYTLCERTGTLLSSGSQSVITFNEIYINDQEVTFKADGVTVDYTTDREGTQDITLRDLVQIRCYNNGSSANVFTDGASGTPQTAYDFVPTWTSTDSMSSLVFAVIKMSYDKDKGLTRIPTFRFKVTNTLTLPGDCVYDYMTNTRYGAGIAPGEIYSA